MKKALFILFILTIGCQKEEIKPIFDSKVIDYTFDNLYWHIQYVVESNVNDSIKVTFDLTCFNKDSIYHLSFIDKQKAVVGLNVYNQIIPEIKDKLSKATICNIGIH